MPELPEVEVVKRSLETLIVNRTIKDIEIKETKLRYKVSKRQIRRLIGLKILKIKRRSKYLIFIFNKGIIMIVHLGMTGKFFIVNENKVKQKTSFYYNLEDIKNHKHNHIIFIFSKKLKLIYNDVRKFGFIKCDLLKRLGKNPHLTLLGPEPLENIFNFSYFKKYIKGKSKTVKDLLMDQKFVSGLGNIYVNEILFNSKIKPTRQIKKITDKEIKKILHITKKILNKAIKLGGSSIKDFLNGNGKTGSFQQYFNVYGKKGDNCSNTDCNAKIEKIVLSSRSSFLCPRCQK